MTHNAYARYLKLAASKRSWAAFEATGSLSLSETELRAELANPDFDYDPTAPETSRMHPDDYLRARELCWNATLEIGAIGTDRKKQLDWDRAISSVILDAFPFTRYDALRIDSWRYVAIKVLPDLTFNRLRHDGDIHGQLFGRVDRNIYGRLWIRADFERRSPGVLAQFKEDNLTGLFERPSLVANERVGLAVAELVAQIYIMDLGPSNKEDLIRDIYKRIVRLMAVRHFDIMPDEVLASVLNGQAKDALEQFQEEKP